MPPIISKRHNKFVLAAAVLTFIGFLCLLSPSHPKNVESPVADIIPNTPLRSSLDTSSKLGSIDTGSSFGSEPLFEDSEPQSVANKANTAVGAMATEKSYVPPFGEKVEEEKITTKKAAAGVAGAILADKEFAKGTAVTGVSIPAVTGKKTPAVGAAPGEVAKSEPLYDQKEEAKFADEVKAAVCESEEEYVVMIDAGSTGSRVHIYKFDTCSSPPKLLNEEFDMLKPGLSSFDTDTVGAAASLDPLLELAMKSVPKSKQGCTPVAVKATAGLRMLGVEKSNAILAEVRRHLQEDYPFAVVKGDGVSIMDGSDEGVYAWITTNYLLGNIGSKAKNPTAAVFDLGGGSTQIVFEPTNGENMLEGEHKYEISFGGRDFVLYQYSHLGYGLMQGRRKINALLLDRFLSHPPSAALLKPLTAAEIKDDTLKTGLSLQHPCLPPGVRADSVKVELEDKSTYLVNFVSLAENAFDPAAETASTQCKFMADAVLNKDMECESKSCSFNGIYQPSLKNQFTETSDMFIFSYFYDRLQPIGMPLSFTLQEMKEIANLVCRGAQNWAQDFKDPEHIKELESEPLWCMDLTFMTSILHTGYDIPLDRELKTAKKISDNELGWCLGASLPLLDKTSGWECKIVKDF